MEILPNNTIISQFENKFDSSNTHRSQRSAPSTDLEKQIEKDKKSSLDYQLLKKLIQKNPNEDTNETDTKKDDNVNIVTEHHRLLITSETKNNQLQENITTEISNQNIGNLNTLTQTTHLNVSANANDSPKLSDPLILDLDGNGIQTTRLENGIEFDINADGKIEKTSFVSGNDAFLSYDKNGNGIIDNGSELFGDQNGAKNGYEELAKYDSNQDGLINSNDEVYQQLLLVSLDEHSQIKTQKLSEKISEIDLNYQQQMKQINQYDLIAQQGNFTDKNGNKGITADVLLAYDEVI